MCLAIKTSTVEAGGWGVNTSLNQPPIQKCQNFPNESPIVRASRKLPPLVIASHAGVFKIWSLFVCCMYKATQSVLIMQKKLSVTAWNYSCKINLEIACNKIYSLVKSSCVGSSSQKRTSLVWFSLANTLSKATTRNVGIWGDRLWKV